MADQPENANTVGLLEALREGNRQDSEAVHLNIIVMGPSMVARRRDAGGHLRKHIIDQIDRSRNVGLPVRPEEKALIAEARRHYGEAYDLCPYELKLADICDLVVIIPSSPGSFAELGMLATDEDLAPKIHVLFDRRYSGSTAFLMNGPKRALKRNNAQMNFVDYNDVNKAWDVVAKRIEQCRATRLVSLRRASSNRASRRV